MKLLKNFGVSFALDDFGTRYSTLVYLRKLSLDQLKIDHLFMREVLTNKSNASIVKSIIALASSLGCKWSRKASKPPINGSSCAPRMLFYQGFLYRQAISTEHFVSYAGRLQ